MLPDTGPKIQVSLPVGLALANDYQRWAVGTVTAWQGRSLYGTPDPDPEAWVPIPFDYARRFLGPRHVAGTLRGLCRAGVLETDHVWSIAKRKARCYRLRPRWRRVPLAPVTITHREICANAARARATAEDELTPVHRAIRRWTDTLAFGDAPPGYPRPGAYFCVDEYGRVHHHGTVIPPHVRPFVSLGGRTPLVALDVASSQPLLLSAVLLRGGGGPPLDSRNFNNGLSDFQRDCLAGVLYDRLREVTGLSYGEQKRQWMIVAYGKPNVATRTPTGRAVASVYPGLLRAVAQWYHSTAPNRLAHRMQRTEVETMIGGATAAFLNAHPDAPVMPVHDCLVVPAAHAGHARACILGAWRQQHRLEPHVREQSWGAATAS